jgi:hypothetical protein
MSLQEEIAADFAQLIAENGRQVTINGQPHIALISEPAEDVTLEEGGLNFDTRFTAKLARSAFADLPKTGQPFLYGEVAYTIRNVVHRPPHPILKLEVVA